MLSEKKDMKKGLFFVLVITTLICASGLINGPMASASYRALSPMEQIAYRPVIMARNGMVCSGHPLASQAGMRILLQGGNAVDAAVAVASCVTLFEPAWSNPGGPGLMMVYKSETKEIKALNFTGKAPYAAKREMFTKENYGQGPLALITPGNFGGWVEALKEYGTMSLAQVLQPVIEYAEQGVPISIFFTFRYYDVAKSMSIYPNWSKVFFPNGRLLEPDEIYTRKDLAATFKKIVAAEEKARYLGRKKAIEAGRDVFYKGEIAQAIVKYSKENGGLLTEKDLADYQPEWSDPISSTYRGYTVYTVPPNSSALSLLQELNIMEGFDVKALGHNTPEYIHTLTEAIKLARADRWKYIADPKFVKVPIKGLLSKQYAEKQRKRIDPKKASKYTAGNPEEYPGTTQISIADRYGNMVSITQTGGYENEIIGDTGIAIYGMRFFDLEEGDNANFIEGGKRPRFNMSPSMIFKDGKPFMVFGTPGGDSIWQTIPQLVMNIIDFGMNIQTAIEAPRIYSQPASLALEKRIPVQVKQALEAKGHKVIMVDEWNRTNFGSMNGIIIHPETNVYMGGADPRREGYVVGW
jgi:gamma-glutamyltranspeptidase/glutathione hydrolase